MKEHHPQARGKGKESGIRRARRTPHPFKGLPWGQREEAEASHWEQREEVRRKPQEVSSLGLPRAPMVETSRNKVSGSS